MPNFGTHLSGPIRHTSRFRDQSDRAWFRDLPIGMNDPDFSHLFVDYHVVQHYNTTDYTLSSSGTGTSAAVVTTGAVTVPGSSIGSVNGILQLQTGSTAGNYANVQNKAVSWLLDPTIVANTHALQSSKRLWFEASFAVSAVASTTVDAFIGLSETQTNVIGLSQNYVGFRVTNSSTALSFVASTAGTTTSLTLQQGGSGNASTLAANSLVTVGFVWDNSNNVAFYFNRNYIATVKANALPTAPLALSYQIQSQNTGTNYSMYIDYAYLCKTR